MNWSKKSIGACLMNIYKRNFHSPPSDSYVRRNTSALISSISFNGRDDIKAHIKYDKLREQFLLLHLSRHKQFFRPSETGNKKEQLTL
jgi:hypothetical protein